MSQYVSGSVYINEPNGPRMKGDATEIHAHKYDHTLVVLHGAGRIESFDGGKIARSIEKRSYEDKPWVLVAAGVRHRFVYLEDGTRFLCFHSHRRPDTKEIVAEYTGWREAYE